MGKTLKALLAAIVKDDRAEVRALLAADEGLAARGVDAARLYKGAILHWMYVGDTALHLAAAGYRVAIARLLLAAGANPNAAFNHRRGRPLHYAADGYVSGPAWNEKAQLETVRLLLDAGRRLRLRTRTGQRRCIGRCGRGVRRPCDVCSMRVPIRSSGISQGQRRFIWQCRTRAAAGAVRRKRSRRSG